VPEVVGANVTVNETLWPAASVTGSVTPEALKADPETFNCVTVVLTVPVFERETFCVLLVPTVMLPNVRLD
jgi:hypothetical protein